MLYFSCISSISHNINFESSFGIVSYVVWKSHHAVTQKLNFVADMLLVISD